MSVHVVEVFFYTYVLFCGPKRNPRGLDRKNISKARGGSAESETFDGLVERAGRGNVLENLKNGGNSSALYSIYIGAR